MSFKPYASISKVENGFTVSLEFEKEKSEHDYDSDRKEYIYSTFSEALEKVTAYFGA